MHATSLAEAGRCAKRLRQELTVAVTAVAAIVGKAQHRLPAAAIRRKGLGDFVTLVDVRAERQLRAALAKALPEAGFLGEESKPCGLDREWVWVVDPIDGTSNFARGLPHFAVAVALLWRGQPVLACLHCAPEGSTYTAVSGAGAHRDGRRIHIPAGRLDDGAVFGCQWQRDRQHYDFLARLQRRGGRIRTFGSTVVQLADVAMGRLDGNVQEQGRVWDVAAAGLLVLEAGGRFTDWTGRPVFPLPDLDIGHIPTVAAPANIHRRLLALLAR